MSLIHDIRELIQSYDEVPDGGTDFDMADDVLVSIRNLIDQAPSYLRKPESGNGMVGYPLELDVSEKALARAVQYHQGGDASDTEVTETAEKFRTFLASNPF